MNRLVLSLSALSFLVLGCAGAPPGRGANAPEATARLALTPSSAEPTDSTEAEAGTDSAAQAGVSAAPKEARKPGDFVVYRFSGSFRKAPLTLTERVVAREGAVLVIDMTLADDAGKKDDLRVRFSDDPASRGEVISVARMDAGAERPATIEAYEALMAEVALAADQNEALLGTEDTTVDVGGTPLPCRRTSYQVKVGKRQATMRTLESDAFAWGDLGGEITAKDGTVLYRAEILEAGSKSTPKNDAVAQTYEE
jgi:hypothetical protein